jgi:1-acyl-sn-glycerol-3-phosphate acyltransferase
MSSSPVQNFLRYWRVVALAGGFAAFGLGGLALSVLGIPLLCFCLAAASDERRRRISQRCIHESFRFFIHAWRFFGIIDYRIENAAALKTDAGCIIVANHPSLIDYVFIVSLMSRCDCIVKEALWNNFFMRGIVRCAGYIPNRDAGLMLNECRQKLSAGNRILIFPEGTRTRTRPDQPLALQRGAANIAIRCGVSVRLIHIACRPVFLSKNDKWWRGLPSRPMFHIRIGDKIDSAAFLEKAGSPSIAARHLTEYLTDALTPANASNAATAT